jgi:DNA-directed RNA polymerase alpha subunit
MENIKREEFEKAVKIIELYVIQQESVFLEAKGIFEKVKTFFVDKNQKLIDADISVRLINVLRGNDINTEDTIKEFSEKCNSKDFIKYRNVGKKSYLELKKIINQAGIPWG